MVASNLLYGDRGAVWRRAPWTTTLTFERSGVGNLHIATRRIIRSRCIDTGVPVAIIVRIRSSTTGRESGCTDSIKGEFVCNNCPNRQTKNIAFITLEPTPKPIEAGEDEIPEDLEGELDDDI